MMENTIRSICKQLTFEKSGETFSITVRIENVPPSINKDTVMGFLDTLYENIKKDMNL